MNIYLDNAATTRLDPEVYLAMEPFLMDYYGNPSSLHWKGRETRLAVEDARKMVAELLGVVPGDILFTSGGTEADNTAILSIIRGNKARRVITTPLEHHAVLNTLRPMEQAGEIELAFLSVDEKGRISLAELELLLKSGPKTLVSLMHGNNEIGNMSDIYGIGEICSRYGAFFHSDTVQTIGHYPLDMKELQIDYIVGSAHKFHGPKGAGFLCRGNKKSKVMPLIHGGSQENRSRAGTENVSGIVGMAKALEVAYREMEECHTYIQGIKNSMISQLKELFNNIRFNGDSESHESLYTVLNVSMPSTPIAVPLLSLLDYNRIAASGGSACNSGADSGSHVINALGTEAGLNHIRFSFSKFNTEAEISKVIGELRDIYQITVQTL